MFYTLNTFTVGNGIWGSKTDANLHGLRHFITRVPENHRCGIEKINFMIHARRVYYEQKFRVEMRFEFGTAVDATTLHMISRALRHHFKSLKVVVFQYCTTGPGWSPIDRLPCLSETEVVGEFVKMFQTLVKKGVKFEIFHNERIDMSQAIAKVLTQSPEAAPNITFPRVTLH